MIELLSDLWQFMRVRKKFWLAPIILVMILLGGLIVLAEDRRSLRLSTRSSSRALIASVLVNEERFMADFVDVNMLDITKRFSLAN